MVVRIPKYSDIHDLGPCHGRCLTCESSLSCWQQTNLIPSQSSLNYSEPSGHSRHEARPRPSTKMADDSLTPDLSSPSLPPPPASLQCWGGRAVILRVIWCISLILARHVWCVLLHWFPGPLLDNTQIVGVYFLRNH